MSMAYKSRREVELLIRHVDTLPAGREGRASPDLKAWYCKD